jgi:L-Ala-D/L-Glu epimerase
MDALPAPRIFPLAVSAEIERWPLNEPFRIAGHVWETLEVVAVTTTHKGLKGKGEAAGIFYLNESPRSALREIQRARSSIEGGVSRTDLNQFLRSGGARNAVDCALWDLECKIMHCDVAELLNISPLRPVVTTYGCGADTPERMARQAQAYTKAEAIKLKLTGEPVDQERVEAVREARPDVWLSVDANQGFSVAFLEQMAPTLVKARVSVIEQPLKVGEDRELAGLDYPIAVAADESVKTADDLISLPEGYDLANIKLDKCGGLTEALGLLKVMAERGLRPMIGNMFGTSLAMAPALVIAQHCEFADLDGPIFLTKDRSDGIVYGGPTIQLTTNLWGTSVTSG